MAVNIQPSILFFPRQAFRQVVPGPLVSEHETKTLRLRPRSELSHEIRLEERWLCRKISHHTRFFYEHGGAALLVARYTTRNRNLHLFFYEMSYCNTTIPATVAHSLVSPFVHFGIVTRFLPESYVVIRRKAVSSAQGPLFLLGAQDHAAVAIPSRNTSLVLPRTTLFCRSSVFGTQVL